ncbi:hypothetical protein, partial [Pseudomonas rhodesiae]|uniref:hypothetical protein n=1 Tax=Pseudomonas rhodesiae TaxID=76760 RepID=UPI00289F8650
RISGRLPESRKVSSAYAYELLVFTWEIVKGVGATLNPWRLMVLYTRRHRSQVPICKGSGA